MRRLVYAVIGLGLVAVLVIGLVQSGSDSASSGGKLSSQAPSDAAVERAFRGSPPALAALHEQANQLLPGGRTQYARQLKALRGHPVVVNFWASWCGPCRLEFPTFQRAAVTYGRRVAFLGVNSGDNRGDATRFLRRFPVTYPSVEDRGQRIAQNLGPRGLPATAFYTPDGKLEFLHQGYYRDEADLATDIKRYLNVS